MGRYMPICSALFQVIEAASAHAVLEPGGARVSRESAAEKRARRCQEAGQCLCRGGGAVQYRRLMALRDVIQRWIRVGQARQGRKIVRQSPRRVLLDKGELVIRMVPEGGVDQAPLWCHVAVAYHNPLRCTFLRMASIEETTAPHGVVSLRAAYHPDMHGCCWWCSDLDIAGVMMTRSDAVDDTWEISWWRVVGDAPSRRHGGQAPMGVQCMAVRDAEASRISLADGGDSASGHEEEGAETQHQEIKAESTDDETTGDSSLGDSEQEDEEEVDEEESNDVCTPPPPTP